VLGRSGIELNEKEMLTSCITSEPRRENKRRRKRKKGWRQKKNSAGVEPGSRVGDKQQSTYHWTTTDLDIDET
jgi:hypothetical protein